MLNKEYEVVVKASIIKNWSGVICGDQIGECTGSEMMLFVKVLNKTYSITIGSSLFTNGLNDDRNKVMFQAMRYNMRKF